MEENKDINIQNNHQTNQEKNEKNGRGLFYFVIAFAVIIIAVVGATYAYFTATARSDDSNAVTAGSTEVSLGIEVDRSGANTNLIPVAENIAKYAYAEKKEIKYTDNCIEYAINEDGEQVGECIKYQKDPQSTCLDDNGAEVCSTYTYTVINSNNAQQKLKMYLGTTNNQFANLWFAVYTDTGIGADGKPIRTRISEPQPVAKEGNQEVEVTPRIVDGNEEQTQYFSELAYPTLNATIKRKTYTIVLWIKELYTGESDTNPEDDDQTELDGRGKTFSGYVRVSSGEGGVTGVIGDAADYDDTVITSPSQPTSQPEENEDENSSTPEPSDSPTQEPTDSETQESGE